MQGQQCLYQESGQHIDAIGQLSMARDSARTPNHKGSFRISIWGNGLALGEL